MTQVGSQSLTSRKLQAKLTADGPERLTRERLRECGFVRCECGSSEDREAFATAGGCGGGTKGTLNRCSETE